MIDSFITYDSNPAGENSPGFFSKHLNDIFSYNFLEADTYSLLPNNNQLPPINEELPQENLIDHFSSNSAYSTNPSVKHSPEYTPNEEDQAVDDKFVPSKVPPIIKKGIKKQYEPIFDNGMAYYYDEDPAEYRKARKRIQNRESATRVRYRKRTRAEELEDEVKELTRDKAELKVQNASLVAENGMLKSQINLLERMIARTGQEEIMIDGIDSLQDASSRTDNSDSIMHLITKPDDDMEVQPPPKYFRASPAHNFKKHVAMLGVFTLLLCVYGMVPRTTHMSLNTLFSRPHTLLFGVRTDSTPKTNINSGNLRGNSEESPMILWMMQLLVMVCYFVYLIYVAVGFFKYRALRKKAYAYTSLSS